ncbi:MAG: TRAP transporter small permease [Desulfovibrio sp.]|nr:TRAP transporter small permease [Desulfovibrio sp.]
MDSTSPSGRPHSAKISVAHAGKKPAPKDSTGEFLFQIFCAVIFLSMIGLVSYNAFLRYVFRSSFPPSEEWARFLFIYITFFGAIEAFYRHKHIAVDLVTDHLHGLSRKVCDLIAICFSLGAMLLLLVGGVSYVMQTMDTYSVATNINMTFINAVLPICAAAAIIFYLRDLWLLLRTPSEQVNPKISKEEKIARLLKENM